MSKINNILEEKMLPLAAKLGQNKVLIAIRDGITLGMPLIIIGSLFLILNSFPVASWTNWLQETGLNAYLDKGTSSSFGLMGMIASFGIASSLAHQYKVDGMSAGAIAMSSFLIVTPTIFSGDEAPLEGIQIGYMGSKGLFVAIILGLISAWIFQWFINRDIQIKLPDTVPPAVARSFSALIPGAVIISLWTIVYGITDSFGIGNIHDAIMKLIGGPLGLLGGSLVGTMIVVFFNSLFWFIGIHGGNVVNSIFSPIWLMNTDENRLAFQADPHAVLPHIVTGPFMDNFVYIGGGGATLGLVIVIAIIAIKKKASIISKTMAPLTLTPGIFNINEPAMFGLPVVLNLKLLIPFILAPVFNVIIAYLSISTGLVQGTVGISIPWTMPPIISGFLATGGHVSGAVLQIICILVDILIYLPFYRSVENQNIKDEQGII